MEYSHRFVIGIDLGTTNSAVSYVDFGAEAGKKPHIQIFKVPQLTGHGEVSRLPVMPSFLYIPGIYDIAQESIVLPWHSGDTNFVGAFARDHGAKVPNRLVSSAKSWLCHAKVDRRARILPWGADDKVQKVSPVQATASYLNHIRRAWNSSQGDEDELYLENQMVILTVPASFDEVARELTVEAAASAGLRNVTLLEEPLAAFYSWLIRHEHHWSDLVKPNELILVCDVGGGTTDFTLITLREAEGSPRFERIAVGDHLILGGDNIDLALARRIELRFQQKRLSLNSDRWKALCHQCRQAKELILDGAVDSKRLTLIGEGGQLIAGTLSANLQRQEVIETVLEGFFPPVDPDIPPNKEIRKGITEFGLPYEAEPAITRHLGWFLDQHKADVELAVHKSHCPDLILFNGGSLKPAIIQERIRTALRSWFKQQDQRLPRVLENPYPDLAVAMGAAYYGLVKTGQGVRVGSGSARAFYLGVAKSDEVSASPDKQLAICLVERGLDEGSQIELKDRKFEVLANQPVSFDLYSSSFRSGDKSGDIVAIDDSLTVLPSIQTMIQYGKKGIQTTIPVRIEAAYTEMGTLALWCRSMSSNHRWQLQFQLRDLPVVETVREQAVFESSVVESALNAIRKAFAMDGDKSLLQQLIKQIGEILDCARDDWPLTFLRSLADELLENTIDSRRSPDHESRWLNLVGFCLRPGFGDGFDTHRVKQVWKIHKEGPRYDKNLQVRSEWWIMWRRVAGGLNAGQQRQFIQELTPLFMPKKGVKTRIPPQERLEIWMAVANMERLLVKDKIQWGRLLLSEMGRKNAKSQHFWALSRMGARELLYGPADRVVPPEEVAAWISEILSLDWRNPKPVAAALVQMARLTGDRTRDLEAPLLKRILDWMPRDAYYLPHRRLIEEIVPMAHQEESVIFGESLPTGIVLHA